ncbi:oligosaccharide flippase family protein [Devosia sp. A449]
MLAAFSGLAGRLVTLLAPVIATPAMLAYFGDADFGLWATAVSITTIAVVADLGIGSGLLTRVSAAHGHSDALAVQRYVSSALAILGLIAAAVFVVTAIVFWVFGTSPIVSTVVLTFILGIPGALFFQFLFAVQRVPLANILQIVSAALSVSFAVASIALNLPPWVVTLAYSGPPVFVTYVGSVIHFTRNPNYRPALRLVDLPLGRDLLRLGSQFFVLSVLTAIGMNVDNIVVASQVGPDAVAAYSIPMRLGSLLTLIIVAITMPMWGANGEAIAKQEYDWVQKSAARISLVSAAMVTIAGALLFLASDWIIQLWVGRSFENQRLVILGFVALSIVTAITSPYNMVLNALGKVRVQIYAWGLFVVVAVFAKLVIAASATWALATVSAIAYAAVILPAIIFGTHRALEKARAATEA